MKSTSMITETLLAYEQQIDPANLFPTLEPAASDLIAHDPYAFSLATCLDRGTKADIIWTITYYIKQDLGHLDPFRINAMSDENLADLFSRLRRRPRYINAAPRTVQELTSLVVQRFNGDASLIWKDRSAFEVKLVFQSIYGVGVGIANMAVILIEKAFGIHFSDLDHAQMDIKPDVHTMRVLFRLGISPAETEQAAIQAARTLRPEYPGEIDGPLWIIGRTWCHASRPDCQNCHMGQVCPEIGAH
jgi:endonuclease III